MNDLISRQEAIDVFSHDKEMLNRLLDDMDVVGTDREKYSWALGLIESYINDTWELPPAEPKKGRWIFTRYYVWECSKCGKNPTRGMGYTQGKSELFRYCPHCGAKMEAEE